jgi:predicted amidohydrolase
MKIALCQINPTVGDLASNHEKIVAFARRAAEAGADLAVFPELCVVGYPPLDLLESPAFIDDVEETVRRIAAEVPPELGVILGAPVRNTGPVGKRLFNAALLFEGGQQRAEVHKVLLPTYDVFDEVRYFEPGDRCEPVSFRGVRLGLHVCEDMWNNEEHAEVRLYEQNPIDDLAEAGAELYVNISASPFSHREARRHATGSSRRSAAVRPAVRARESGRRQHRAPLRRRQPRPRRRRHAAPLRAELRGIAASLGHRRGHRPVPDEARRSRTSTTRS